MLFIDRSHAGRLLALRLHHLDTDRIEVFGLPRGGVPVAYEVAKALHAPLDVIVVRKLGVPFQPELAAGAIGERGIRIVNEEVIAEAGVTAKELDRVETRERRELERRAKLYRSGRPPRNVRDKTAVVVDDGMATGSTAFAACRAARLLGAARVVLAVPVAPADTVDLAQRVADEVVCLECPAPFFGVGQWYRDFPQVSDDEVVELLHRATSGPEASGPPSTVAIDAADCPVHIDAAGAVLEGDLVVPSNPLGVVVFAHGSGSSRNSPRNRSVAHTLNRASIATLLVDLLTAQEERDRANVFDVELLGSRLTQVVTWLESLPSMARLPVGLFGASTGAAAALWTATEPETRIAAVVSRGGRPDLASARLGLLVAPTLLIVGGNDPGVRQLNEGAAARMRGDHEIRVVSGATHLFEEPGALAEVARLAVEWFTTYFTQASAVSTRYWPRGPDIETRRKEGSR